jgi:hypothetical protein
MGQNCASGKEWGRTAGLMLFEDEDDEGLYED